MRKKLKYIANILLREKIPKENVIAALFDDEKKFIKATKNLKNIRKLSAITPYPVHGLEEILNIKRSWIPWVALVFGLFGLFGGFFLTWWTSVISWPLIIGGKPFFSLPAFIPVIFECTILFSALAVVISLFWACDLPKVNPPILDSSLTDHQFALYCPVQKNNLSKIEKQFKELGADKIVIDIF